jgi:hypothetical protein
MNSKDAACATRELLRAPARGGLREFDECRFGVSALVTLERAQIDTGGVRLDAGEHHLAATSLAFRPFDDLKLTTNKLRLRHGLLP